MKSGCKIEKARLATKERLEKLIALKSIIAFKILYLSKAAISNPEESCSKILTSKEWQALYIREYKTYTQRSAYYKTSYYLVRKVRRFYE